MNKKIISIKNLENSINFIIHINNICNFKCAYCTAGHQTSPERLTLDYFEKIIITINKLRTIGDKRDIYIDITGGEPTLNNDLIEIVDKLLNIDKLYVQVTTNLYKIQNFTSEIEKLKQHKNIKNFAFNISYHFFEYLDKDEIFIDNILMLKANNISFNIKFLLPDSQVKIYEFDKVLKNIIEKTKIKETQFFYDLITKNGVVSTSYSKCILDFYIQINKNHEKEKLLVKFENDEELETDMFYIRNNGLNRFKGFDCYYVSKNYIEIQISHNGYITFGPCYMLDSIRYDISQLFDIISKERKIICGEQVCECGITLNKVFNKKNEKISSLEELIRKNISKVILDIEIQDIQIFFNKSINIIFILDNFNIILVIEKYNKNKKYYFSKNDIGYDFRVKDNNNISYKFEEIEKTLIKTLKKNILLVSTFDNLFTKIL
ncbi:MAG: radical SAM protein [Candidatus Gracilibacteria bacterium]|nr:radical SAM protein [Candidatus Gracilibacteria bacterium]